MSFENFNCDGGAVTNGSAAIGGEPVSYTAINNLAGSAAPENPYSGNFDTALSLTDMGFHVHPVHEQGRGVKFPFKDFEWKERSSNDIMQLIEWWRTPGHEYYHPDAAPAIDCEKSELVVIDADFKYKYEDGVSTGLSKWLDLVAEHGGLPSNTPIVQTPSQGHHAIFRQRQDREPLGCSRGQLPKGNEVRGVGGYVVGCGATVEAGTYTLVSGDLRDIPEIPEWLYDVIQGARRHDAKDVVYERLDDYDLARERQKVAKALRFIPSDDRESHWLPVGMAIASHFGDDGRDLWDVWSAVSKTVFNEPGQEKAWNSFSQPGDNRGGRALVGAGSIFALAKGYGYPDETKIPQQNAELFKEIIEAELPPPPAEKMFPGGVHAVPQPPPSTNGALDWPELDPLIVEAKREPYPLEALPDGIRSAVDEVQAYVKCPVSLVASSALAALAIAAQGLADVRRDARLLGPCGLYFLLVADSSERKSTVDKQFSKAVRDYDQKQRRAFAPRVQIYEAQLTAWEATNKGLKSNVERAAKTGKPSEEAEEALEKHALEKPAKVRVPCLLYENATTEALLSSMADNNSMAAIVSAEGGTVLGGYSMRADGLMQNLATLNKLWDGDGQSVRRATTKSFDLQNPRLAISLAVQTETIRQFIDKTGGLARGSGFAARFLTSCPESTAGSRDYEEPRSMPHLDAFQARVGELLDLVPMPDDEGQVRRYVLDLSPEAKEHWKGRYNAVELSMGRGGGFADLKDVAGKAAENAARIAACFHILEYGEAAEFFAIEERNMAAAWKIVEWHLTEAKRFFAKVDLPEELRHAAGLDEWLIATCNRQGASELPLRDTLYKGPGPTRKAQARNAAVVELAQRGRVRCFERDGKQVIAVNPALLGEVRS
jgi:Protein of unknown function (DUF3987)/Bifunctional DNA primase/polymerase, N-terminal/Primase C terminal 2 (PriCT-2)